MNAEAVYQALRQELLEAYTRQVNLVAFAFTATGALIGYALITTTSNTTGTAPTSLIFLLPLLVLALLFVQLNNTIYTIFTISVYIRVFIERKYDIPKWEIRISDLRSRLRKNKPFKSLRPYNPVTMFDAALYAIATALMGLVCVGLSLYFAKSSLEYSIATAFAAGWMVICVLLFRPLWFVNSGKYEEELEKIWQELKTKGSDRQL